jgi:hypothetical protein
MRRNWNNWNGCAVLVVMENGVVCEKSNMTIPQKAVL